MKYLKTYEYLNMRKIYFAHPINTYNTYEEKICIDILEENHFVVLNPNEYEQQEYFKNYRKEHTNDYMKYFGELVNKCDDIGYLPFDDGFIGSGVVYEIKKCHKNGGNIYEIDIKNRNINKVDISHILEKQLSIEETRKRVHKI